eukprot:COSAG02_NODE_477_length_21523_cov_11.763163_16_plen_43_part_00
MNSLHTQLPSISDSVSEGLNKSDRKSALKYDRIFPRLRHGLR